MRPGEPLKNCFFSLLVASTTDDHSGRVRVPVLRILGLQLGDTDLYIEQAAHVTGRPNTLEQWYRSQEMRSFHINVLSGVHNGSNTETLMTFEGRGRITSFDFSPLDGGGNEIFRTFSGLEATGITWTHYEEEQCKA